MSAEIDSGKLGARRVVATLTLGCKLNQAETQQAARELQAHGCVTVDRPAQADAFLINTCTITHVADRKARRLIRLARRLSPEAPIVVTGCYAEAAADTLAGDELVQFVDNAHKHDAAGRVWSALEAAPSVRAQLKQSHDRTRAFIKIQEGCNDVCAFCIVPYVRGRERAAPIAEIVSAAQERVAEGVQEIVLTGTQPGAYGRDRSDGSSAAALIEALLSQTDAARIRYSSIQPQDVTAQLLACWDDSRMCRHVHLALQSGSDAVLSRMRRRYSAAQFRDAAAAFRSAAPGISVTTDIIAGFPGETDADHRATLDLMRELRFTDVHVFPYSERSKTSASLLADDVPPEVKRSRALEIRQLGETHRREWLEARVGAMESVLFETPTAGLSDTYLPVRLADRLPEEDGVVDYRNQIRSVRVEDVAVGSLIGALAG